MNRVELIGRLTAKPELRYTSTNLEYTKFSLAVNRIYSNTEGQKEADFINIQVWRKQAENVCEYLNKGNLVAVTGRIETGSYDDKDGNKRYTTEVVADNVEFLERKQDGQAVKPSEPVKEEDPYADFGISIDENDNSFLD